jgi:hypothetical protein
MTVEAFDVEAEWEEVSGFAGWVFVRRNNQSLYFQEMLSCPKGMNHARIDSAESKLEPPSPHQRRDGGLSSPAKDAGCPGEGIFQEDADHLAAGNLCHTAAGLDLPSGFDSRLNAAVAFDKDTLDQFGCDILGKLRGLVYDFFQCHRHGRNLLDFVAGGKPSRGVPNPRVGIPMRYFPLKTPWPPQ